MKHTPTPWKVCNRSEHGYIGIDSDRQMNLAKCAIETETAFASRKPFPEGRANAAFIVRACNAHDLLLDAAKRARALLEDHAQFSDNTAEARAVKKLDEAISMAEGK